MNQISPLKKANYGIDAPGVVRNLLVAAFSVLIITVFFPVIKISHVTIDTRGLIWASISCGAGALWMILYSVYGKYKHRDKMIGLINWSGTEQVLDIGTGKGLLLIGAAKQLINGKATGIDIWNAEDLTGNNSDSVLQNAMTEGVSGKIEVLNENVVEMGFADEQFDVIFSNECLHNIYNAADRVKACNEIVRVLKQGGHCVISDHQHMQEYKTNFEKAGLQVKMFNKFYLAAYPPLRILYIKK